MRSGRTIQSERIQSLLAPGRAGDPGAGATGAGPQGRQAPVGMYVTYSGAVATVHTRLLLGVLGHGLGSELS